MSDEKKNDFTECGVCGSPLNMNKEGYVHCRHCFNNGKPSGKMVVKFDDFWVYVNCANCGRLVYRFAKMIK